MWDEIVDATQQIEEGGEPSRLAVLLEHRANRWRRYAILAPEPGYAAAADIAVGVDEAGAADYMRGAADPDADREVQRVS
ncbi:hypothetical protein [Micromonospora sp. NPDC004551]|uniref:hypothetical protein n=1 Tax=Micromonospora sp. NPDC004551 TaxID=3154284 RepID=UPI0033BF3C84